MPKRSDAQKTSEENYNAKRDSRYTYFAFLLYPDSAPDNWMNVLRDLHLPIFISPCHDKDIDEETGELKKPHYHILINYGTNKKTIKHVSNFAASLNQPRRIEQVDSYSGMARYLCHIDNPEKYRYKEEDVISLGGANYFQVIMRDEDKYDLIGQMMDFCDENQIYGFATLTRYARHNRPDWFIILCDKSAYIMKEYLKSSQWEHQEEVRNYMKDLASDEKEQQNSN